MYWKRWFSGILCLILFMIPCVGMADTASETVPNGAIQIESPAAILVDAATGQVLWEKDSSSVYPISGTVKVMSMLLYAESIQEKRIAEDSAVQISATAAETGGTQAFLDSGETYDVQTLLRCVGICSANDAAVALAETAYGSESAFVEKMNSRAKELGASTAVFTSCTGWNDESKCSATDMAKIACELIQHKSVLEFTSIYMDEISHPDGRKTSLTNPNRMVRFYDGCDGLATGSAGTTGYCGVITAKRGEMRLIAIVLGAENSNQRFTDAQTLLEYGFANYTHRTMAKKGEVLRKNVEIPYGTPEIINLVAKEDIRVVVPKGRESEIRKELVLNESIEAPIEVGQVLGELKVYLGDDCIATCDAVAETAVSRASYREALETIFKFWLFGPPV